METPDAEDAAPSGSATLPPPPPLRPPCERLSGPKSSVCSRSYFVVVMVFFHVYIINVIALLFYVHYSSGQQDASRSRDAPGGDHQRPESRRAPPSKTEFLRDVSLTRVEGIRVSDGTVLLRLSPPCFCLTPSFRPLMCLQVGHVQRVSLAPGKVHEMRTLSLKPLLFGKKRVANTSATF